MSDKQKAMFILEAIGELSEKTVAEAKAPASKTALRKSDRYARDHSLLAASIVLIAAASAALILGAFKYNTQMVMPGSATADEIAEDVGMDYAIKAAMDSLSEEGVSSTLTQAVFVNESGRPYYLVKLSSKNGSYDCEVDAKSGKVLNIAHKIEATEPPPTEIINMETEPEYEEDYDDDYEEEYDYDDIPSKIINSMGEKSANDFKEWNESHGISYSLLDGVTGNNPYSGSSDFGISGNNQNGVSPYSDKIIWDYN